MNVIALGRNSPAVPADFYDLKKGTGMIRSTPLASLAIVTFLLLAPEASAVDFYKTDQEHTSIVFGIAHKGLSYTYGMFREARGQYWLDTTNPANCKFQFVVRASSIDTNNKERDEAICSDWFFDVKQFPDIRFDSTKCELLRTREGGIAYKLAGNFTLHGVTIPVENIVLHQLGEGPGASNKDYRTGFACQLQLKRSDFGMNKLLEKNLVGDAVGINISFEGVLQQQSATPPRTTQPQ
jgi:polyisoprenoid-binding protein YceI